MPVYCETAGRKVSRLKDNKTLAHGYDRKHAKAIAKLFNAWHNMGWPYIPIEEK